jgi:glycine cleavage system transcriptional repressor
VRGKPLRAPKAATLGKLPATMNDSPAQSRQLLAISAIGADRPGLVHELTRAITDCGGSIAESRMASLGSEFAMVMLVGGNWHALARLESELKRVAEAAGLTLQIRRAESRAVRRDLLPYSIDIVSLDQTGIVAGLSGFCATRSIDISEVATRCYAAAHTGAPMFAVQMMINVPSKLHVSQLREEFMDYCDTMNLDAILEPVKS